MVRQKQHFLTNTENNNTLELRVWDRKEVLRHLFSLNKAVWDIPAFKSAFLFFFCREVVNWKA